MASKYRGETRRERYLKKVVASKKIPFSIATVNFDKEVNIAYVIRAAACFGAFEVCVIGNTPSRDVLNDLSGSTYDYVDFNRFSNTESFVEYCKTNNIGIVSLELPDANFTSIPLNNFAAEPNKRYCLVVGHETLGVPIQILAAGQRVYIPMPGLCFCLNTAQAANIAMYEMAKRCGVLDEEKTI